MKSVRPKAKTAPARPQRTRSHSLRAGTHVIWPAGLEEILGLSAVTRWRWERDGRLPRRDISIAGRTGWKRETIEGILQGATARSKIGGEQSLTP